MPRLKMERGKDYLILRAHSTEIKKIDKKLLRFFDDMVITMEKEKGIGLAAPQVGVNTRVVVCKFNPGTDHEVVVPMVNPQIVNRSAEMDLHEEGCLSLPKWFDSIARHTALTVKYLDRKGRENVLKLKGLNARIVQHEVDHIDGKLFIDHLDDDATKRLKQK